MLDVIICSYSRTIARWLTNKFPGDVELDSAATGNDEIIEIFRLLLPGIEFYAATQGNCNLSRRIKQITGIKTRSGQLNWLLDLFEGSRLPELVKDELYVQLKLFVKWKLDREKIIEPLHIVRKKSGYPVLLSAAEKKRVLDTMRLSLALHCRETDPVTYANARELEWFEMGGEYNIALVGMQKEKRLSLENYIGYMVFKSGVPVAYGGGWIWGKRCRIGINIYPDFRKTASALIFTQVLHLYYQHYNSRQFIVRANQFGQNNPDGLRSGAFWFYYKMGFRPACRELKRLARDEWKQIRANKNYRSSLKTLRIFTSAPMEWAAGKIPISVPDPESISRRISDLVNTDYAGSRKDAVRSVRKKIMEDLKPVGLSRSKQNNEVDDNWCLLLNLFGDLRSWKKTDKEKLVDLIRVKQEGKERDHIMGLQTLSVFWKSLKRHNF